MAFASYKGEAEKALLASGFPVYIFRPAYIYPVEPRKEPNFSYRLLRAIYPAFRLLFWGLPTCRRRGLEALSGSACDDRKARSPPNR